MNELSTSNACFLSSAMLSVCCRNGEQTIDSCDLTKKVDKKPDLLSAEGLGIRVTLNTQAALFSEKCSHSYHGSPVNVASGPHSLARTVHLELVQVEAEAKAYSIHPYR